MIRTRKNRIGFDFLLVLLLLVPGCASVHVTGRFQADVRLLYRERVVFLLSYTMLVLWADLANNHLGQGHYGPAFFSLKCPYIVCAT